MGVRDVDEGVGVKGIGAWRSVLEAGTRTRARVNAKMKMNVLV